MRNSRWNADIKMNILVPIFEGIFSCKKKKQDWWKKSVYWNMQLLKIQAATNVHLFQISVMNNHENATEDSPYFEILQCLCT